MILIILPEAGLVAGPLLPLLPLLKVWLLFWAGLAVAGAALPGRRPRRRRANFT